LFGLLKMTSEMDLASFYKKFAKFRATLIKQGHPVPEDNRKEQKFLQRLDDQYSDMMTAMANGTMLGVRYPKSLAAAYKTTANYVVPLEKMKKSAGSSASTYLTSDESNGRGGRGVATGGRGVDGRGSARGGRGTVAGRGSPPPKKQLKKTVKFVKKERSDKATGMTW
jgi:hypothetical protein